MSQPHIQLRNALLDDHVAKGWMDGDMFLAYSLMLRRCDWSTGVWHGSAASLAALSGGQWSLATAKRILNKLCLGRYITSHHVAKQKGNYDIAINNFIPTTGENKGKKVRRTKTRDYRIRITSDSDNRLTHEADDSPQDSESGSAMSLASGSPASRIQDVHLSALSGSGVGVGSDERSESPAGERSSRIAFAIADASPSSPTETQAETQTQPQPQLESESGAPVFEAEMQAAFEAHIEDDGIWLANYLWMFLNQRPDTEIIRPWERLWAEDFNNALADGYSKEDLMLAILTSQIPSAKKYYRRAGKIAEHLDLLIEKGHKLSDRGVLREWECECGALFAMLDDLRDHQETCEDQLPIDPVDAAEEEAMYAAEDLIGYGLAPDPMPDFDPFADTREGENWQ